MLMRLTFGRLVNGSAQNRRAVWPGRYFPWRVSNLGLFVLAFSVLLEVCIGQFYETPGYSNLEEMAKDLKKWTKGDTSIKDANVALKNKITEMAEQFAELRAADEAEKAKQE